MGERSAPQSLLRHWLGTRRETLNVSHARVTHESRGMSAYLPIWA
jgi:hypothetical protein